MKTDEAIKLQNEIKAGPGTFDEKWKKEEPIRAWSEKLFREACKTKDLITSEEIRRFVAANDSNCHKVDPFISGTIRDDEEFKIVTWIDYDMGWTWAKYNILHKPTNTKFHNWMGLKKD